MPRPKGAKNKVLGAEFPREQRLKILKKIATSKDPTIKSTDKLNAIKLYTEILSDKVIPEQQDNPITNLKYILDESLNTPKVIENIQKDNKNTNIVTDTTTTPTINNNVSNIIGANTVDLIFKIDENNKDEITIDETDDNLGLSWSKKQLSFL